MASQITVVRIKSNTKNIATDIQTALDAVGSGLAATKWKGLTITAVSADQLIAILSYDNT